MGCYFSSLKMKAVFVIISNDICSLYSVNFYNVLGFRSKCFSSINAQQPSEVVTIMPISQIRTIKILRGSKTHPRSLR